MIVVAGRLHIVEGQREAFLALSHEAILLARKAPGCIDFVVSADPVESDRANVYEAWETADDLHRFRGSGPTSDIAKMIARAEVRQYTATPAESASQ